MAKKKSKKKSAKPKKTSSKKKSSRQAASKKLALKKSVPKKKLATKSAAKKSSAKPKAAKKTIVAKPTETRSRQASGRRRSFADEPYRSQESQTESAGQSGDLQGLSNVEGADSESIDDLVEEGNAFEADVVAGVERAGNEEGKEVRTREVPEDDVPTEYLDEQ